MSKICPNCQTPNRDIARFCHQCAAALVNEISCPACSSNNVPQARFCSYCAAPLTNVGLNWQPQAQTGLLPANTILAQRYIIVNKIGGGGMAAVYLALDQRLQNKVWAIKEMSDASITNPLDRQHSVASFRQEAQLLANLDHIGLPKVSDFFTENGHHYLTMDFIQGKSLETILTETTDRLTETSIIDWSLQLCDVLAYLHQQTPPVIFRDLKPDNIMLNNEGRIKLIDFGIARLFQPGKSQDTQLLGTPGFAAPEQYGPGQTDVRTDIYAFGVSLHRLLTGYDPALTPFTLPPVRTLVHNLSPAIETIIDRATKVNIDARFQSVEEVRESLLALMDEPKITLSVKKIDVTPPSPPAFPSLPKEFVSIPDSPISQIQITGTDVENIRWSTDGAMLAFTSFNRVYLYNAVNMAQMAKFETEDTILSTAFCANDRILALGGKGAKVHLWDLKHGCYILGHHKDWVSSIKHSTLGNVLASALHSGEIKVWNLLDRSLSYSLSAHTDRIRCLAVSDRIELLASGTDAGSISLWRLTDGKYVDSLSGFTAGITDILFSPDGTLLACGDRKGTIHLWDTTNRTKVSELNGHTDWITGIDFSPDGAILASASLDKTVRFWRTKDGAMLRSINHQSGIWSIAFSPKRSDIFAFGDQSGDLQVWNWKTQ